MTGLYSETQDDSSADLPQDIESESLPSTITVTTNFDPVQTQSVTVSTTLANPAITTTSITASVVPDTVIKCHSRQPSASLMDREKTTHHNDEIVDEELLNDCGILSCRPAKMQKLARIRVRINLIFAPSSVHSITKFLFTDFCSSTFNAGDTSTGTKLRLHKFRHNDDRKTLWHPLKLIRADSFELWDRKCRNRHFCKLLRKPPSHPCVDWNWWVFFSRCLILIHVLEIAGKFRPCALTANQSIIHSFHWWIFFHDLMLNNGKVSIEERHARFL